MKCMQLLGTGNAELLGGGAFMPYKIARTNFKPEFLAKFLQVVFKKVCEFFLAKIVSRKFKKILFGTTGANPPPSW